MLDTGIIIKTHIWALISINLDKNIPALEIKCVSKKRQKTHHVVHPNWQKQRERRVQLEEQQRLRLLWHVSDGILCVQLPTSPAGPLNSCAAVACASTLAGGAMESLTATTNQTRRTAVSSCFFPPITNHSWRIVYYPLLVHTYKMMSMSDLRMNTRINDACLCTLQPLQCAQLTSSVVETDAAFVCRGGVMARTTALTTAMKRAVRKPVSFFLKEAKFKTGFKCSYDNSSQHFPASHLFHFFLLYLRRKVAFEQ